MHPTIASQNYTGISPGSFILHDAYYNTKFHKIVVAVITMENNLIQKKNMKDLTTTLGIAYCL